MYVKLLKVAVWSCKFVWVCSLLFFVKVLVSRLVFHRKTRGKPQAIATLKFSYFALLDFVFEKC